jgi:hypothetical protein
VQSISLDKVIGSAGRYQDFIQTFLPTHDGMSERWQRVARMRLDPTSRGWPPIQVYQVGDGYFVIDGNHRVSVANHLDLKTIEAHVWEFLRPVAGLAPGVDINSLVLETERQEFLQQTRLDELRPGHSLRLTAPGGYPQILGQLADFQQLLSRIDRVEVSFEEAVTAWYDMTYTSTVLLIEQSGVLEMFPNRTAADFFVWYLRHHRKLEEQDGEPVSFEAAFGDGPPSGLKWLRQSWRIFWQRLKGL